jgi:hypothetical protein
MSKPRRKFDQGPMIIDKPQTTFDNEKKDFGLK